MTTVSEISKLEGLNEPQLQAVKTIDGPLLILAGAGSGKTRVLTRRIAYLIGDIGVPPWRILAMTFTNKAAGEMRDRVEGLLDRPSRGMWIGTFHSVCARLLRTEHEAAGLGPNFSIYDSTDQLAVVRKVLKASGMSDKDFPPKQVRGRIGQAKNMMSDPDGFARTAHSYYEKQVADLYRGYQAELEASNAVDFDDLLMKSVRLLNDHPAVLKKYQERFEYILIDEYQDTNRPQYLLTRHLAASHQNLCVVGDDDQSIYAWRGADIRNILDFERDYPETTLIRLEQNYRSTQIILDASNAVIANNEGRKGKRLWTDRKGGEPIRLRWTFDEQDEARWLVTTVQELKGVGGLALREQAVLYRTNAQSRAIEEQLVRANLPYVIVGDVKFYERREIKDVLGYLRLIDNPLDVVSLARVINTPRRGIGDTSFNRMMDFAAGTGEGPYGLLGRAEEIPDLSRAAAAKMKRFWAMIEAFREKADQIDVAELTLEVLKATDYAQSLGAAGQEEAEGRRRNLEELLANIEGYVDRAEDTSLGAYLREVSLMADVDEWDDRADALTLMTLHSAKGLEFRAVYITGLEEGLFPIVRAWDEEEEDSTEEERRLFYVGITRAKERLFLSHARQRRRFGGTQACHPSRFLAEIPERLLDEGRRVREVSVAEPARSRRDASPVRHVEVEPSATPTRPQADLFSDPESDDAEDEVGGDGETGSLSTETGAWVIHPYWGRGVIEARSGSGGDTKLTVRFQGVTKKIVLRYARLLPG